MKFTPVKISVAFFIYTYVDSPEPCHGDKKNWIRSL